jgi:hypothetical protein
MVVQTRVAKAVTAVSDADDQSPAAPLTGSTCSISCSRSVSPRPRSCARPTTRR